MKKTSTEKMRVRVGREDGTVLAQVEESGEGRGGVILRLYRDGSRIVGPAECIKEISILEAMNLASALRVVREHEIGRMRGAIKPAALGEQGEMELVAALDMVAEPAPFRLSRRPNAQWIWKQGPIGRKERDMNMNKDQEEERTGKK